MAVGPERGQAGAGAESGVGFVAGGEGEAAAVHVAELVDGAGSGDGESDGEFWGEGAG